MRWQRRFVERLGQIWVGEDFGAVELVARRRGADVKGLGVVSSMGKGGRCEVGGGSGEGSGVGRGGTGEGVFVGLWVWGIGRGDGLVGVGAWG